MNLFLYWKNSIGQRELVTPPLGATILPGVTRDSILSLTRKWRECIVAERLVTMPQITKALEENRVLEMFGSGISFET